MSNDVIDQAALEKLLSAIGGDVEDLDELIDDFTIEGPDLVAKLNESANSQDWNQMRISAHSLKSNAREFGAIELGNLCQSLEQACQAEVVDNPMQQVEQIEIALQVAISQLLGLKASRA